VRSIYILQQLQHPNIIRCVDYILPPQDISIYVLYEPGKKGSLDEIKGPLREQSNYGLIRYIMLQLAEGLEYLSSVKVAHRDLKVGMG
jgi:serine/threonine protein kinase